MAMRPDEIVAILRRQIEEFETELQVEDLGSVLMVGDGIARVYGLEKALAGELLEFPGGTYGMVLNLEQDNIGVVILGPYEHIKEGDPVRRTKRVVQVPVGEAMIGRVVNPLGQPIDGKGPIKTDKWRPIETRAPGVVDRVSVNQPLQTGLKAIDSLVPIGRGQRELIIGDRQTGKTALAIDTIINQKGQDEICVYVAIGQKANSVAGLVQTLAEHGVLEKCVVVAAMANEPPSMLYMAPYAGCAIAEDLMLAGKHVLIIYDDLTKHAKAYREISLLLRRPPGREAFPGDVFYLHSRLLERAARLSDEMGGGSLTALPIIETQLGDLSAYIPTNVISITDGQIYLDTDLFYQGIRPAIDVGLSVSRVGGAAQLKAMKEVAGQLRLDHAQYRSLAAYAKLSADELDKASRDQLARGDRVTGVLKQNQYVPMPVERQVVALYAVTQGLMDDVPVEDVVRFEKELLDFMRDRHREVLARIKSQGRLDDELVAAIRSAVAEFKPGFFAATPA